MSQATELAALLERDLARLKQQVEAFPDAASLWKTTPGVSNSAGNLALHLEGNLREYIGRQLGGIAYSRRRDQEFSSTGLSAADLAARIDSLRETIPAILADLTDAQLAGAYPQQVFGKPLTTSLFLLHLHGHFHYHLGQIDYLRRMLTQGGPVDFAQL